LDSGHNTTRQQDRGGAKHALVHACPLVIRIQFSNSLSRRRSIKGRDLHPGVNGKFVNKSAHDHVMARAQRCHAAFFAART
jgi:hypothetical protein